MMSNFLFDTIPGFDEPIAVLKHCHDKIRKQILTMQTLLGHLARQGADWEAQQAAKAVLQYFNKAAHLHHEDEEQDLMPMLQATATDGDAALLLTLVPEIKEDHRRMDLAWVQLKTELVKIADGSAALLSPDSVAMFADAYQAHMAKEETQLAPMAKRIFSPQQMTQLGQAMQKRRGIGDDTGTAAPVPTPAPVTAGPVLAGLRTDYSQFSLMEADLLADPVAQFGKWFDEAVKAQVREPNTMTLATVGADGRPGARIVLIKQFDQRGFSFFTNYDSEKGRQLRDNPHAALLFFWSELERQVRIEGRVEKTTEQENDDYFNIRPLQSRLAAIASAQSEPIESRAALDAHFAAAAAASGEQPLRPAHWGGYRLVPQRIEFWQGRPSRFHDRIVFTRQDDGSWRTERLQP